MLSFIHTGDIHLGLANHGKIDKITGLNSRVFDVLNAIDYMIEYVKKESIPYIFIAGDVFHTRIPAVEVQVQFAKRIKELSSHLKGLYILLGNHDVSAVAEKSAVLEIVDKLDLTNIRIIREHAEIYEKDFNSLFIGPYVSQEKASEYIQSFLSKAKDDLPKLLFCHPMISGVILSSGVECENIKEFWSKDFFNSFPEFDYIGMGHIHKHQVITTKPISVYCGSLISCDFSEREAKGFIDVRVGSKTEWKHVVGRNREFFILKGSQEELLKNRSNIKDKIVRLEIDLEADELLQVDQVKEHFSTAFNVIFKILRKEENTESEFSEYCQNKSVKENLEDYFLNSSHADQIFELANELGLFN